MSTRHPLSFPGSSSLWGLGKLSRNRTGIVESLRGVCCNVPPELGRLKDEDEEVEQEV